MRIAIVSPEFPPDIGGIETYAWEFTRELASQGHQVTVFTCRHEQGEAKLPGVEIRPVLRLCRSLDRAALDGHQAEIWHAMNAAYAWLALEGKRTVVSVHGNDFLRPYLPVAMPNFNLLPGGWRLSGAEPRWLRTLAMWESARLVRRALPRAQHIIANSRYTEQTLLARNPDCEGRTSVAWVGVSNRFFAVPRQPAGDGIKRLITVCRLSEPRKNVDRVLKALSTLKDRFNFRYTVIGDGHDRPRLEALTKDLGLAERVKFAGFVDSNELMAHYAQADMMVLASSVIPGSHEGFGIVYLEAAASGVPSLAARLAGAAEAVEEGTSGCFVESPEVDALTARLQDVLNGTLQFEPEACRSFARGFNWAKVVDHAVQRYTKIVHG